jgi:general secretion pathway protein B
MSFILDALKKSENARQRQIGPAVAELPRRRRQSERPVWAFVVVGLLLVNIGVLALVLARNKDSRAESAPATAVQTDSLARPADPPATLPSRAAIQYPQASPAAEQGGGAPLVSSLAEESGTPNELDGDGGIAAEIMRAQVPEAAPEAVRPIQAPAVAPLAGTPAAPPAAPAASPGSAEEILPTVGELAASGRTFPNMRLDIHSFADKPADRFVFVNMRRYNEGQTLQEGPSVERITEEGVVLNQQGLRFLLPRP